MYNHPENSPPLTEEQRAIRDAKIKLAEVISAIPDKIQLAIRTHPTTGPEIKALYSLIVDSVLRDSDMSPEQVAHARNVINLWATQQQVFLLSAIRFGYVYGYALALDDLTKEIVVV